MLNTNKKYKILVNGKNLLINYKGKKQKLGFFTNRFVEAANPEEAEEKAMQLLREKASLRGIVLNSHDDAPMMYAKEITELKSFDGIDNLDQGLSWYVE